MIWCSAHSVPGCILMWPWLPVKVGLESFQEICPGTFLDRRANIWTEVLHQTKSGIPFGFTPSCRACTGCGCTNMIVGKPYMGRDLILDLSIRPFAISQPRYLNRDISTAISQPRYIDCDISTKISQLRTSDPFMEGPRLTMSPGGIHSTQFLCSWNPNHLGFSVNWIWMWCLKSHK